MQTEYFVKMSGELSNLCHVKKSKLAIRFLTRELRPRHRSFTLGNQPWQLTMCRDTFIGETWSILYLKRFVKIEAAERGESAAVTQQEDVACITLRRGKLRHTRAQLQKCPCVRVEASLSGLICRLIAISLQYGTRCLVTIWRSPGHAACNKRNLRGVIQKKKCILILIYKLS